MRKKKLIKAIESAISNLENSIKSIVNGDTDSIFSCVWGATAETEYALFLFALLCKKEFEESSWKFSFNQKTDGVTSIINALNLLKESKKCIGANNSINAYKKAWVARNHLINVHDFFERAPRSEIQNKLAKNLKLVRS